MARQQGSKTPSIASEASSTARGGRKVGYQLRSASAAPAQDEVNRGHEVRFDLTANIAYHAIREQFFVRMYRLLTGLQILLGTSAVATLMQKWPTTSILLLLISALAGVVLLVIDPSGSARDHRMFRTRLHAVLATLEEAGESIEQLRKARAEATRIAGEAPPAFRAVSAIAYNTAVNATYREEEAAAYRYKVGFWQRFFANIFPMRGTNFRPLPREKVVGSGERVGPDDIPLEG